MGIKYLDAKRLRRILIGGAKWVKKHEDYLNELNVYPVPDGDTGSNMSMTLETVRKELETHTTKKTTMNELIDIVEEAVLMGARGNSGTILSQIITGFLRSIRDKKRLESEDLALALQGAREIAYMAVDTPVEGTILTVIRMVSEKAAEIKNIGSLDTMLEILTETAKLAVDETPNLLDKLKEAGVVDSGAMGLYYFFVGMSKTLTELDEITKSEIEEKSFDTKINSFSHDPAEIHFKYCTEFIICSSDFDTEAFKKEILKLGDSAVFAQTSKKFKVHVHTNEPGKALELAANIADLEKIKIENMKLQNEGLISSEKEQTKIFVNHRENISRYSYVILADSLNLKDEFIKLGADVVLLGGQSQNPSVQDMLNAIAKVQGDKQIIILPNNKNVISTANIAAEKSERNITVIPTKTMLDGHFFIKHSFEHIDRLKKEATLNYSIEITKAVRDTSVDGINISIGDYIALVNTKIKHCNSSLEELIKEIKNTYMNKDNIYSLIAEGKEKDENIKTLFNDVKNIKFLNTDQDNYPYYIYIYTKNNLFGKVAVITDSASDLNQEEIKDLPIYITPIRLEANGAHYRDGVNLSKEEFWNKLIKNDEVFKSSQPSPMELTNLYSSLLEKGYEKIIVLNISSSLSGTFKTAKMVINSLNKEKEIIIVDSLLVAIPLGILVKKVAEKLVQNASIEEILKLIEKIKNKIKPLLIVDTLKYLERGGRISKVAKSFGDFLNLKPILTLSHGSLTVEKKAFGDASAISYIEKEIEKIASKQSIFIYPAWGGEKEHFDKLNKILDKFKNNPKITIIEREDDMIGATVGTHSGPIFGVCIIPKLL